jgi:hypothetical protein
MALIGQFSRGADNPRLRVDNIPILQYNLPAMEADRSLAQDYPSHVRFYRRLIRVLPLSASRGRRICGWLLLPHLRPSWRVCSEQVAGNKCGPSVLHRMLASAFILGILCMVLGGLLFQIEDWPLTAVPMFATPIENDGARYALLFRAVQPDGSETDMPSLKTTGVPDTRLKRLLFGRFYGSVNPNHPLGKYPRDTAEEFQIRMSDFCTRLTRVMRERQTLGQTRAIRLVASREAFGRVETHVVGTFYLAANRFQIGP